MNVDAIELTLVLLAGLVAGWVAGSHDPARPPAPRLRFAAAWLAFALSATYACVKLTVPATWRTTEEASSAARRPP